MYVWDFFLIETNTFVNAHKPGPRTSSIIATPLFQTGPCLLIFFVPSLLEQEIMLNVNRLFDFSDNSRAQALSLLCGNLAALYRPTRAVKCLTLITSGPLLFSTTVTRCSKVFCTPSSIPKLGPLSLASSMASFVAVILSATLLHTHTSAMDEGDQTDVIFADFAKTFDRLDHGVLLEKPVAFGLSSALS